MQLITSINEIISWKPSITVMFGKFQTLTAYSTSPKLITQSWLNSTTPLICYVWLNHPRRQLVRIATPRSHHRIVRYIWPVECFISAYIQLIYLLLLVLRLCARIMRVIASRRSYIQYWLSDASQQRSNAASEARRKKCDIIFLVISCQSLTWQFDLYVYLALILIMLVVILCGPHSAIQSAMWCIHLILPTNIAAPSS